MSMKAVLLAGGLGTRMREETEFRPKPMVEIGGKPVLWHLMKFFSAYGITDFVICAGYKGEQIKEYFLNYAAPTLANIATPAPPMTKLADRLCLVTDCTPSHHAAHRGMSASMAAQIVQP